jgi:hypothetical protein
MAEKQGKKKKGKAAKRPRSERRFVPEQTQTTKLAVGGGMIGAFALGAGVYAQWVRDPALSYGSWIVAGGAVALGAALWFGDPGAVPLRVGDAGLALEKGSELVRLAWCDIERIFVEKEELIVKGDELTVALPLKTHARAVAWVLAEGARRIPFAMDVKRSVLSGLPEPKESDGELIEIGSLQVAGRHCASSDKPIAFERDARLCPNCAEVYHKDHVPKKCVTCETDIAGRAYKA